MRRSLMLAILLGTAALAPAGEYLVLDGTGDRTELRPAIERLAEHRGAEVARFDPDNLAKLEPTLRRLKPRLVAIVLPPERVELDFQRRLFQLATRLDDDPFVDFAWGYVTGASGRDALGLVEAGITAEKTPRPFRLGVLAGGGEASSERGGAYPLRGSTLPQVHGVVRGEGEEHDRAFVARFLPRLDGCGVIELVGHGMPGYVAGGPDAEDLAGWKLDAPVILSVPCFTGVTHAWWEEDWSARVVRRTTVPLDKSFALRVIAAGPSGYTAFLCGRPAGPELYTDLLRLVVDGSSLGDVRRRDYDKTVLGFLGFGEERVELPPLGAEGKIPRARDLVRDVMLEGAVGGILYGDPAVRPFPARPGEDPVEVGHETGDGGLVVTLACPRRAFWSLCGDQTARFDGTMALRAYARVPLADLAIGDVAVDRCRLGDRDAKHRVIWAVEDDHGERWLHVKLMFSRNDAKEPGDLDARLVVTSAKGGAGRRWGGDVEAPVRSAPGGGSRRDLAATTVDPDLERAAERYDVPRKALEAALVATAATLGKGDVPEKKAIADLRAHGANGFRAMCALLLVGHSHYRTAELLGITHRRGLESLLIELATEDLPGHADWSVLEGLGATGTAAARKVLLERIGREGDLGKLMATAAGLARLGERRAVPAIAARLLDAGGVEGHLVNAIGRIGGPEARRALERYAEDPRARHAKSARDWLARMD